jgi:hypothetical protein
VKLPITIVAIVVLFMSACISAGACSMASCLNHGDELRPEFDIFVTHDDKPLAGVTVEITQSMEEDTNTRFRSETGTDGRVRVNGLAPGDYWLHVHLLNISATYRCFHVADKVSRKAKRKLEFAWGDLAPAVAAVAGTIIDLRRGTGGTPIWNLTHPVKVPVAGAGLILRNAIQDASYNTSSTATGAFTFQDIPPGTYVLHIQVVNGREEEATDLLLKVNRTARPAALLITRNAGGGGSCGGTDLSLQIR